jgi:hypothetical protein
MLLTRSHIEQLLLEERGKWKMLDREQPTQVETSIDSGDHDEDDGYYETESSSFWGLNKPFSSSELIF